MSKNSSFYRASFLNGPEDIDVDTSSSRLEATTSKELPPVKIVLAAAKVHTSIT